MSLPELLASLDLRVCPETVAELDRLVDELLRWNRRRNLTAITDRDEVLEKHLADSLSLLPAARQSTRMLDIGSGAGFPALPLKIACPELEVVAVDAVGKKIEFQRHIVRTLGLGGYLPLHERIETLAGEPEYQGCFDLVTARALCSLAELITLSQPFLAPGGRLVAMKGPEGEGEVAAQADLLKSAGWNVTLHHFKLPASGAKRCLVELVCKA